jgi:STELLO glycosyltransferases
MKLHAVITTIQEPTDCVRVLVSALAPTKSPLLVIGDKKGPARYDLEGARLVSLEAQGGLPFRLAQMLPTGSYTRKNLGYLIAMSEGAPCIYETDDDNRPLATWRVRDQKAKARRVHSPGWYNVFRYFSADNIWPRGFPLSHIRQAASPAAVETTETTLQAPVQQGLVNGNPDVDAIWRLTMEHEETYENKPSIYLPPGVWSPFNSQSAWWWPQAYPLMYLPGSCTFRMTDIWRGFIALRCLWALGCGMVFHAPEVYQDRNLHNLMRDFEDEVPGYLQNANICECLEKLKLKRGTQAVHENLHRCYAELVSAKIFPKGELRLVEAWLADVAKVREGK